MTKLLHIRTSLAAYKQHFTIPLSSFNVEFLIFILLRIYNYIHGILHLYQRVTVTDLLWVTMHMPNANTALAEKPVLPTFQWGEILAELLTCLVWPCSVFPFLL